MKDLWPAEAMQQNLQPNLALLDTYPSIQMLEYMKHGDMHSMLDKIAHSDTAHMIREQAYFSKHCWKIFICRKSALHAICRPRVRNSTFTY